MKCFVIDNSSNVSNSRKYLFERFFFASDWKKQNKVVNKKAQIEVITH